MKIQNTQTNVGFGDQYAVYTRAVVKEVRQSLEISKGAAREEVRRLLEPIGKIKNGHGLLDFRNGKASEDKKAITLWGLYIKGRQKGGKDWSYLGEGVPIEITLPRDASPEMIQRKVSRVLNERRLIN